MHFEYCPHCGTKTVLKEIGDEGKIPYCGQCQIPLWDLFTVCIICAVINEYDEIALIRQQYVSAANFVCVAGVVQFGENGEETAVREIEEELGLTVEKLEYVRSYFYEKKQMLMLGYRADVKKSDFHLSEEVDFAAWIPLSEAVPCLREGGIAWQLVKEVRDRSFKN